MASLKKFVLVVQSGTKRLNFLTMYGLDFVIFWAASLEEAQVRLKRNDFDFVVVDIDHYYKHALEFCRSVMKHDVRTKVFLKDPNFAVPEESCPHLVLDNTATEWDLAQSMEELFRPKRRTG